MCKMYEILTLIVDLPECVSLVFFGGGKWSLVYKGAIIAFGSGIESPMHPIHPQVLCRKNMHHISVTGHVK